MKLLMCAIFDSQVKAFTPPFYSRTKSEAMRSFADAVGKSDSPFCNHPNDYTLFYIGEFDDNSGGGLFLTVPEKLLHAFECVPDRSS